MKRSALNKIILLLLSIFVAACSGTRHLPAGEKLYTGASIKLESTDKLSKRKKRKIRTSAEEALRPKPNKSFLGMRPRVWMYVKAGPEPKTKFKKWLQKKGEAPVLMSSIKPTITSTIIDAKLYNIGIFRSYTSSSVKEKKRTGKVIYTSRVHKPYVVDVLTYSISNDSISKVILKGAEKSIIRSGEDYSLDKLKAERVRVDELLKNAGYFYFNPDHLLFKADTSETKKNVKFRLTLKDSIPANSLVAYKINNIYIDQEYSLNEEQPSEMKDTFRYENTVFVGKKSEVKIRPKVILRSVYFKKHGIYTRKDHTVTLNRLMSMGNFKFVRIKFADSDTTASGYLDVSILMTSMPKRTVRAEFDLVSKSNNYAGPRMNFNLVNRNTFNGAELLNLNMAGSYEIQLSGKNNLYSYSVNPQVELFFPRFILPFKIKRTNSLFVPRTRVALSYNYLKRVSYFDMRTGQFIYGFKWKEDVRKEHELNPISISYTSIVNRSQAFEDLLAANPYLKKSYEEQFIAGSTYSYIYNEQVFAQKQVQYFVHPSVETAGNLISLVNMIGGEKPDSDDPAKMFGSVYSQYFKMSVDGRIYYNFEDKNKLVFRVYAGAAKPYGNSSTLPYSKQFFSGGPNSIRAFHINSVGPGTHQQNSDNRGFLQLGGDIKLESNLEYRFNIVRFLKGAVFVDAGNIWLMKKNPAAITEPFDPKTFHNELAVGGGIGLRVDVSFFILRFDLATPLRKPWLEGDKWVTNKISFGNPAWRSENLILNVAIGYPF